MNDGKASQITVVLCNVRFHVVNGLGQRDLHISNPTGDAPPRCASGIAPRFSADNAGGGGGKDGSSVRHFSLTSLVQRSTYTTGTVALNPATITSITNSQALRHLYHCSSGKIASPVMNAAGSKNKDMCSNVLVM